MTVAFAAGASLPSLADEGTGAPPWAPAFHGSGTDAASGVSGVEASRSRAPRVLGAAAFVGGAGGVRRRRGVEASEHVLFDGGVSNHAEG